MAAAYGDGSKPHALAVAYPLVGHINPLLQLSKLLARAGFSVGLVTAGFAASRLVLKENEDEDIRILTVPPTQLPPLGELANPIDFFIDMHATMQASFEQLLEQHTGGRAEQQQVGSACPNITCIISDFGFGWVPSVAAKWNIPWVCFWPNSLACLACYLHAPQIMSGPSGFDPFHPQVYDGSLEDHVVHDIPGVPPIHASELPFKTIFGEASARLAYMEVKDLAENVSKAFAILVNSFDSLEEEAGEALRAKFHNIYTVGPLLQDYGDEEVSRRGRRNDAQEECLRWLDTQEAGSVLYISMGTVFEFTKDELEEMGHGLAEAKQPFLWVLSTGKAGLLPPQAGGDGDGDVVEELVRRGQGKVVAWAPQAQVLAHEAVGGFLTHCGWNSTLEGVSAGSGMVAWPQFRDQLINCACVVDMWKVGTRLIAAADKRMERHSVAGAVRRLMMQAGGHETVAMRARMAELQARSRQAFTSASRTNLQHFIHQLLQR